MRVLVEVSAVRGVRCLHLPFSVAPEVLNTVFSLLVEVTLFPGSGKGENSGHYRGAAELELGDMKFSFLTLSAS